MKKGSIFMLAYAIFLLWSGMFDVLIFKDNALEIIAISAALASLPFSFADLFEATGNHEKMIVTQFDEFIKILHKSIETLTTHSNINKINHKNVRNNNQNCESIDSQEGCSVYHQGKEDDFLCKLKEEDVFIQQELNQLKKSGNRKLFISEILFFCGVMLFFVSMSFSSFRNVFASSQNALSVGAFGMIILSYELKDVLANRIDTNAECLNALIKANDKLLDATHLFENHYVEEENQYGQTKNAFTK